MFCALAPVDSTLTPRRGCPSRRPCTLRLQPNYHHVQSNESIKHLHYVKLFSKRTASSFGSVPTADLRAPLLPGIVSQVHGIVQARRRPQDVIHAHRARSARHLRLCLLETHLSSRLTTYLRDSSPPSGDANTICSSFVVEVPRQFRHDDMKHDHDVSL